MVPEPRIMELEQPISPSTAPLYPYAVILSLPKTVLRSGESRAPSRDVIAGREAPRLHAEKSFLLLTIACSGVVCGKEDDGWAGRILYLQ